MHILGEYLLARHRFDVPRNELAAQQALGLYDGPPMFCGAEPEPDRLGLRGIAFKGTLISPDTLRVEPLDLPAGEAVQILLDHAESRGVPGRFRPELDVLWGPDDQVEKVSLVSFRIFWPPRNRGDPWRELGPQLPAEWR